MVRPIVSPLQRRRTAPAAVGWLLAAVLGAVLVPVPAPAHAEAPLQTAVAPGWWRVGLGAFEVTALSDGTVDIDSAILKDTPLNEAKQVTDSTLTAIMGREAAYSGAEVEWDQMLNSKFQYGPDQLFTDCSAMKFGDFRTLQPPMPKNHNVLKDPALVPVKA